MIARLVVVILCGLAPLGCFRDKIQQDRARALPPAERGMAVTGAPTARAAGGDDLRVTPVKFDDPTPIRPAGTYDDRKTLPERIEERRERRREAEPEKTPPKMPSPLAPKDARPAVPAIPAATPELAAIRKLYETSAGKYANLTDFEAHLLRREVVGGKEMPAEEILFQFRKTPFSIYMKNLGEVGRGREVLYVAGKFDDKMHVVTGEGDNRLVGAGYKISLKPDSSMATAKSRHKITDAGFGDALAKFGSVIVETETGKRPNGIASLGKVNRKEYPYPLDAVEIKLIPGDDVTLPKGGKKEVYFDQKTDSPGFGLPVLVITRDETGREVEYYCFDRFKLPAGLTDADFTPERLGRKK